MGGMRNATTPGAIRFRLWSSNPVWAWVMYGLVALAIAVTYACLPAADLYNTTGDG